MLEVPNVAIHVESMGVVSYQKVRPSVRQPMPILSFDPSPYAISNLI